MSSIPLQSVPDYLQIQRVIHRYASALDKRQWSALDDVFTEDAKVDFVGFHVCEGRQTIVDFVRSVLLQCAATQHFLGNIEIDVQGDTASATCYLSSLHIGLGDYADQTFNVWGEYTDQLVRVANGWRIQYRRLDTIYSSGDVGLK
jgi:ketosteroid isomerase-like protein